MSASKSAFWSGVQAISPVLVGVFPFATIAGVTLVSVGIDPPAAVAMSAIVFAGAAQLAAADLIGGGAPLLITVFTALVINLRFMMYSASIAPHFRGRSTAWKALLAYLLTDQAYAVAIARFQGPGPEGGRHWFYLGAGVAMWATWQAGALVGVVLGVQVPAAWSLDFAIPLTFLALLVPNLRDRGGVAAAAVAGLMSLVAFHWPLKVGLVVAALAGTAAGWMGGGRRGR